MPPSPTRVPYWMRDAPGESFPSLESDVDIDVAIVGGGLTGLWTAHYLLAQDDRLRIAVIESERVGNGGSGRNGGWVSNLIPGHARRLTRQYGAVAVAAYRDAVAGSVRETVDVLDALGIDADADLAGTVSVALTPSQAARQRRRVAAARPADGLQLLDAAAVRARIRVEGVLGGVFNPHVARVHPGKLVHGLAASLASRGVRIFENSPVREISPGRASTAAAVARAPFVVRATEGFSPRLGARDVLSMNSTMVITHPQDDRFWETVGWDGNELLSDAAHDYVYGQRTADGRIALGGRGVPYAYANRFDLNAPTPQRTVDVLRSALQRMFPTIEVDSFADSWSGVLAVARDWNARIHLDRTTGLAVAGGYVGHGMAATNLAGRTLADLIAGADTARTRLPWVGHTSRRWEPEPARFLGVRAVYTAYRLADSVESRRDSESTSWLARAADLVSGRP